MSSRVIGAYENQTRIDIPLPYDKNGDPAFDKTGKPVKGAEPVTLTLPLWNYMPRQQLKELIRASAKVEAEPAEDAAAMVDKQCDSILASLRIFVDDDQYALLENLTLGELADINAKWSAKSQEPLGESPASAGSSTTTRRR